jgi:hypothetical protein
MLGPKFIYLFCPRSDSEEIDCVWVAYCHQLNLQAAPGGMSSTVARINSVGLKLALRQMVKDFGNWE